MEQSFRSATSFSRQKIIEIEKKKLENLEFFAILDVKHRKLKEVTTEPDNIPTKNFLSYRQLRPIVYKRLK